MLFEETKPRGIFETHLEPYPDKRGLLAVCWAQTEFENHGLNPRMERCNLSFNSRKGTLRGMHCQAAPYEQTKLVRCTGGAV